MGRSGRKRANLIVQGGAMAIGLLFVGACVLLRQILLTDMWGDLGNGMYAAACGIYTAAQLIAAYGLPVVVPCLLKPRIRQGRYKSAGRVMQAAFLYATAAGIVLGAVLFFGGTFFAGTVLREPLSVLAMQILALSLLLSAWNGALRGFFLGNGAGFPVMLSMILEQIVILGAGLPLAYALRGYGKKAGALLQNEDYEICFAAAGFAGGVFAGAALSLVFLLLIYLASHSYYKKKAGKASARSREGLAQSFGILAACMVNVILYGLLARGYLLMQQICFRQFMYGSMEARTISSQWGMYSGKYKIASAIPIMIAVAMGSTLRDRVSSFHKKEDIQRLRDQIQSVFRASMTVVIPLSVMMGVLSTPILETFFAGQDTETASALLLAGFITAVFYSGAFLFGEALWGMGRSVSLLICGILSLAVHLAALYAMLEILHLDIFGVLYADIIYSFCLLAFMGTTVQRVCRFRSGLLRGSAASAVAAAVMGIILFLLTRALGNTLPAGGLLALAIPVGIAVYVCLLLLLRGTTERELRMIPGGKWVCAAARALRLL